MAELIDDIRHIPPWLIVAGVGGIGAVVLLVRRGSGSGAVVSTVPAASITATPDGSLAASGLAGGPALGDATQLQSISTLPQSPPNPNSITTFSDIIAKAFPSSYGQPGATDPYGGTYSASQDTALQAQMRGDTIDYAATIAQAAPHDPNVQAFEQEWQTFRPGGSNVGNWQAWNGLVAEAQQLNQQYGGQQVTPVQRAAGGGSSERIVDILPHGYATEMTPGVLERWADWMGGRLPQAGLDPTQRYVARSTHHELAARHKAATDDAVNELLGGI